MKLRSLFQTVQIGVLEDTGYGDLIQVSQFISQINCARKRFVNATRCIIATFTKSMQAEFTTQQPNRLSGLTQRLLLLSHQTTFEP